MRVRELIAALQQQDPEKLVVVEGCDCDRYALAVTAGDDREPDTVHITSVGFRADLD